MYSWNKISDEWDRIMNHYDGPDSLVSQLWKLKDPSYRGKNILAEFAKEIRAERDAELDKLWIESGWTEELWLDELNRRIDPIRNGHPRYSCNKPVGLPDRSDGCYLERNHHGLCSLYE